MKTLVIDIQIAEISENTFEVHEDAVWMDAPEGCDSSWVLVDGELVPPPEPEPEPYDMARTRAYPSIQEQLDMQYWDSVNGTTTWADAIAAVKAANPKPE